MKITFYFVRHGETLFNRKGRIQGVSDSPLSELGLQQAAQAHDALADVHFDRVFLSPSERVADTAEIILKDRKCEWEIVDDLHEFDFGRYEGTRFTSHPDELRRCFDSRDFSSVDGETRGKMEIRVRETMRSIASQCDDGDRVLIVSHGMFEMFLMEKLLDVDLDVFRKDREGENRNIIPNCGIMVFTFEDGQYRLVTLPVEPNLFRIPAEKKTVRFYYVRHGETLFNQWNRMQGWCDSPLTKNGICQANTAADALRNVYFARAYASPSLRAYRTAEIICAPHRITPVREKLLKEVNFGDFEGVVRDSWVEEINRRHKTETWDDIGGESAEDVETRIRTFLKRAVSEAKDGDNVLMVSHGTYYLNILEKIFKIDREEYFVSRIKAGKQGMPNGGIFTFEYKDGHFRMIELMCPPEEYEEH